jgi:hypothetical protein
MLQFALAPLLVGRIVNTTLAMLADFTSAATRRCIWLER